VRRVGVVLGRQWGVCGGGHLLPELASDPAARFGSGRLHVPGLDDWPAPSPRPASPAWGVRWAPRRTGPTTRGLWLTVRFPSPTECYHSSGGDDSHRAAPMAPVSRGSSDCSGPGVIARPCCPRRSSQRTDRSAYRGAEFHTTNHDDDDRRLAGDRTLCAHPAGLRLQHRRDRYQPRQPFRIGSPRGTPAAYVDGLLTRLL